MQEKADARKILMRYRGCFEWHGYLVLPFKLTWTLQELLGKELGQATGGVKFTSLPTKVAEWKYRHSCSCSASIDKRTLRHESRKHLLIGMQDKQVQ